MSGIWKKRGAMSLRHGLNPHCCHFWRVLTRTRNQTLTLTQTETETETENDADAENPNFEEFAKKAEKMFSEGGMPDMKSFDFKKMSENKEKNDISLKL